MKRGYSYHGLSFNVDMDLEPFSRINPCGYQGMRVTQARDLGIDADLDTLAGQTVASLCRHIGYRPRSA